MKSNIKIRPHQTTLLVAGFATLAGFLVPILRQLLLPVLYLNTHLHELSHALTAQATGADVEKILVNANGGGVTPIVGGNILIVASAGYLGATVFGAAMLYFGRSEKSARSMLATLAVLLTFSMVVWVRGDVVGEISGAGWICALALMSMFLKQGWLMFSCQFLGLQQCLNSFQSLFTLVKISAETEVHSDASILQSNTGIPSLIWALGWAVFSLVMVAWSLKLSWKPAPKTSKRGS